MSVDDGLSGQSVLITGAGGGIGRATALAFAARGSRLLLTDIDPASGEAVAEAARAAGAEAIFMRVDVTHAAEAAAAVTRCVEAFGRLDCAVNNAGVAHRQLRVDEIDEPTFDRMIEVNLKGVLFGMQPQLRQMLAQRGGAIVNVASKAGIGGAPKLGAYAAAKHAVVGLTRTAALEYGRRGIRVNAVCPSYIHTEMVRALTEHAEAAAMLEAASPMKRLGEPREVAEAILWLCSSHSSYVNGVALPIDGGMAAF